MSNDIHNNHAIKLDIAGVPVTVRGQPANDDQTAAQERIEHEARTMRYGVVAWASAS
jgi:hypothetical protein